jgi:hypothetical protein
MAGITVKLEGIPSVQKFLKEKRKEIFDAGFEVIDRHADKQLSTAKGKIKNKTGRMASILKKESWKYTNSAGSKIGPLGASKEDAIAWNSYEYGHAAPGKAGGVKVVQGSKVLRSTIAEDKSSFKRDIQKAIQDVADRG